MFTLTDNVGFQGFDASQVPVGLAARIAVTTLSSIDPQVLDKAVQSIRDRLAAKAAAAAPVLNPETAPLDVEDDDDYEPDYPMAEDTEQILNKLDGTPRVEPPQADAASLALGPYKLPPPRPLNLDTALAARHWSVDRVFDAVKGLEDPSAKKSKAGINRMAASSYDKDSILTFIARVAIRSRSGLEDAGSSEEDKNAVMLRTAESGAAIRERIHNHILEDFRKRIDVAVGWLCEEWYNDKLAQKQVLPERQSAAPLHYHEWVLKLIDGFFPYLNPSDKVLMRFLGEIPHLDREILAKVKRLCADPSMVQLALTSLLYLVMMKPPVRDPALDTVQDIWLECKFKNLLTYRCSLAD